jgi:hypothetical protein
MPALHAVTLLASLAARGLLGPPADAPDCGSAALYLLLQLEGRPGIAVELARVVSWLP